MQKITLMVYCAGYSDLICLMPCIMTRLHNLKGLYLNTLILVDNVCIISFSALYLTTHILTRTLR